MTNINTENLVKEYNFSIFQIKILDRSQFDNKKR